MMWNFGYLSSDNWALPWSIELLEKYEDKWEWWALRRHNSVYEKAFKPYLTDEFIEEVMSAIVKQKQTA